ncbi:MAG: Gfo/Idh/MocA family oxidoreductase [Burkholderiaceae bacterium]|nr:MAG: Gfo/Idh/MocA family oxidoreductase [Burkholderiaceae bacterium]
MSDIPRATVRYGFIGCGMMGQEHLRNLALIDGAHTAAIFEPDDAMAATALALAPGAVRVPSLDTLLAHPGLDALVITSPNHCHADQLRQIAQRRPLPVLCEKPVCVNLNQVAALRTLAATHPAPLWVAMEYRYMPPIAALVAATHSEADTGGSTLLSIREHRYPFLTKVGDWNRFAANTGGTLVEKCCHFFDLMRLLMRADPIRLFASGAMNHNHVDERYDGRQPDILDNALVVLDFPGQRRALLELCMFAEGARYQEEISVVGPRGKIECKVPGPGRFWPTATLGPAPVAQLIVSPRSPQGPREVEIPVPADLLAAGDHNGSTFFQHRRFFDLVRGVAGQPVEVTLDDGLKAVLIGLAAEESARSGLAIDLTTGPYRL